MFKFLLGCFLTLTLAYIAVFYIIKPHFTITSKGIQVITPVIESTFFIPSNTPIKVYKFEAHPKELEKIISSQTLPSGVTLGIYLKNLTTNQEFALNGDSQFGSASLYKLFVMHTIFKKEAAGKLDTTRPDIQQNLKQMIEVSSNDAAYYLVDNYATWSEVDQDMKDLGLSRTTLLNSPSGPKTSPKDVGKFLELIASGQAVDENSSKQMIVFMSNQKRRDRIPALLPNDIFIVNKTGELDDVLNDAAIIGTPENDYILVILSKGSDNPEALKPVMAKMSKDIYEFFENEWKNPPEIL